MFSFCGLATSVACGLRMSEPEDLGPQRDSLVVRGFNRYPYLFGHFEP